MQPTNAAQPLDLNILALIGIVCIFALLLVGLSDLLGGD